MSFHPKFEKIELMRRTYPSLLFISDENDDILVWEGWLQPIQSTDQLNDILNDMDHDRAIKILREELGEIIHNPKCAVEHEKHPLTKRITQPGRFFKINLTDFQDGRLPLARVLEPTITKEFRQHTRGNDGICAFEPWKYPWDVDTSSIIEYVDHVVIWLFKWDVFARPGGKWIGSETDHDPEFLLNIIQQNDACHCGSGKMYDHCHRRLDIIFVLRRNWFRMHNSNLSRFESLILQFQRFRTSSIAKGASS